MENWNGMTRKLIIGICLFMSLLAAGCVSTYESESDELRRSYLAGDMTALEYLDAREEVDRQELIHMNERQSLNREKHESIKLFGFTLFKSRETAEYDKPWTHDNTNFDNP